MSKRPFEETSCDPAQGEESNPRLEPGSVHATQLHLDRTYSGGDIPQHNSPQNGYEASSSRSTRNFTATQACETCRKKKTRCDEMLPCSVCRNLGAECHYIERPANKKETTLAMVMTTLKRLESKIDNATPHISMVAAGAEHIVTRMPLSIPSPSTSLGGYAGSVDGRRATGDQVQKSPPSMERINHEVDHENSSTSIRTPISFSQHGALFWPAIRNVIPDWLCNTTRDLGMDYAVDIEMDRPVLSINVSPYPALAGQDWLAQLPLSLITGLSEAFFSTFNLSTPIMDRDEYFSATLGTVFRQGFGYNADSCLVLNVLALGCLAVKAHEEGKFPLIGIQSFDQDGPPQNFESNTSFKPPEWIGIIREEQPGLRFLNLGRRRAGVLMTKNDIPTCQFYLLSALYYSQIIRPADAWAMINKACVCCLTLLKSVTEVHWHDFKGDILSRLFWTSLMLESIWIQELNLPSSGLGEFESIVPIPKFTPYLHGPDQSRLSSLQPDDTFFQFHFLAQVAHRIMLTRIRNTLYFCSPSAAWPPQSLTQELHHQVNEWRRSLPEPISITDPPHIIKGPHKSPAHVFAIAMLHSRYKIAQFHISRPFLYKALHSPFLLTEFDLQACHDGLVAAMDWPQITDVRRTMPTGLPLKFAGSCQFFGQLLIFYGIEKSPDPRVVQTLPAGYKRWCSDMMAFLKDCAVLSPTIQKDVEILEALGW